MSTIGENRLTIFNLLYEHPMCQYIRNQELNVLILGTDEVANEAFLASFWCGQYPDTKLHITIAAENASEYISELRDKLPGLKQFANFDNGCEMVAPAEKTPYADISVIDVSVSAIQSSGDIFQDDAEKLCVGKQNYIFVSLGDDVVNHLVALALNKVIRNNNGKALMHVFDSEEQIISTEEFKVNYPKTISLEEFKNLPLYRIARNINLAYNLQEDGRCCIEEINDKFCKTFEEEFKKDSKEYTADSSLASAVHVASKLRYCGGEGQYVQEVQQKGDKYHKLVILEHRRWVAYMAIQGYHMPKGKELDDLLRNFDHRDKKRRLHPCMCDCGDVGVNDRLFLTERTEKKPDNMPELDWISLRRYWVLSDEISKSAEINNYVEQLQSLNEKNDPFATAGILAQAIKMLQNGEDNANEQFRMAMDDAKQKYPNEKVLEDIEAACDESNGVFKLAKKRNNKVDFLAIDAQLIEMLPFCISFGEKYKTVITVSAGNPLDDVKLPLLMLAKTAVFYTQLTGEKRTDYTDRLKSFFESRGNNTSIRVESIQIQQPLDAFLKSKIEDLDQEQSDKSQQFIFNIVADMSPESLFAIWQLSGRIPAATVTRSGIKAFGVDKTIESNAHHFNMSVDEFLKLNKWEKRPNALPMKLDDVKALEKLFWETIPARINFDKYDSKHFDTVWDKMRSLCYGNSDSDKRTEVRNRYNAFKGSIGWDDAHFNNNYSQTFDNLKNGIKKKMPELIRIFSEREIIDVQSPETLEKDFNHTEFTIKKEEPFYALSKDSGKFFELLVYYKLRYIGLFDELQTGVLIRHSDMDELKNEYDIIAMHELTPILISCKSTAAWKKEYIYEIASEASVLHGIAVLAIAQDLSTQDNQKVWKSFIDRAKEWHVSILDASILKDEKKLAEKVGKIIGGGYVYPETAPQK